ncbi:MAG: hypothetical protein K8S99_11090 [Planctomycetes bacterium]|nr:hypothetical protein [Planctomycetota bacterium]
MTTLAEFNKRLAEESAAAYGAHRFSALSRDFRGRYWRDARVKAGPGDVAIDGSWTLMFNGTSTAGQLMAVHLAEFMSGVMGVTLGTPGGGAASRRVVLEESGGGDPAVAESFTIEVAGDRVRVVGVDPAGLRDGVVKLVDMMGFRCGPVLMLGSEVYRPRVRVRLGATPWLGAARESVFLGYNAVWVSAGSNGALVSTTDSTAIPEMERFREAGAAEALRSSVSAAKRYGLKTYLWLGTPKFAADDPVFREDASMRGALTWKADGLHVLCTEHPRVRRYLEESARALFRIAGGLDGLVLIIGGEGFYHCFMRPFGVEKGHTNCPRCEALGPDRVVANLINRLAKAAREVNPSAEVVAWPYSAEHVWSSDRLQSGMIALLEPGAAVFTEIEKDEYITTPEGVRKHLWDYSLHLIGPGGRAKGQADACRARGIPIYMKSEPELIFEAPRLPNVPCMDRWVARAEALATCGDGAWVFPAFRPLYGTSAAESCKHVWWSPAPPAEEMMDRLAARIAGPEAGPMLREAWRACSEAIEHSPELPQYYTGPYYLGPAHPMCADASAALPPVFYGRYLFHAEMTPEDGLKVEPTFFTSAHGDVPRFLEAYRQMEAKLARAVAALDRAEPRVPAPARLMFDAEASSIRWFYRTARAHANFYESCMIRDRLLKGSTPVGGEERSTLLARWENVLRDELDNAQAALPLMEADVRLDWYYGGDHSFPHGADMIRAKWEILRHEIDVFLPGLMRA